MEPIKYARRGGHVALVGLLGALILSALFRGTGQNQSSIITAIFCAAGAGYIIFNLQRWKNNREVIRGSAIAWASAVLLLLSSVGGLFELSGNHAAARTRSGSINTDAKTTGLTARLGETVHIGYWSYAVWNSEWKGSIGSGYMTEYPDARFLVLNLTVRNDDKSASTLPPVKLVDTTGREYDSSPKGSMVEGFFGPLKTLNPNVSSSGYLAFDVPVGELYSLKVSGGFASEEHALIELHH